MYLLCQQWICIKSLINSRHKYAHQTVFIIIITDKLVAERHDKREFWECNGVLFEAVGGLRTTTSTGGGLVTDGVQR